MMHHAHSALPPKLKAKLLSAPRLRYSHNTEAKAEVAIEGVAVAVDRRTTVLGTTVPTASANDTTRSAHGDRARPFPHIAEHVHQSEGIATIPGLIFFPDLIRTGHHILGVGKVSPVTIRIT